MKHLAVIGIIAASIAWLAPDPALAQLTDLTQKAQKALGGSQGLGAGLSDDKIVGGLKEALQVGSGNAVQGVSKTDGYLGNPDIKIPLPGQLKKAEGLLRAAGYGSQVDGFLVSMNRAAEKAAPEAKPIFLDAIKKMSIADARNILNGPDDAATRYFEKHTSGPLAELFKPKVHGAMSEVGVTRQYQDLESKLKAIPGGGSLGVDLDHYVTDKSLAGLFFMLAGEEKKIRTNPTARVTDTLKQVFAK